MNLLIVESPNKIKKLKSFLGPGWDVDASVGHIRDLPQKQLSIDKENGYKMLYEVNKDKLQVVARLKKKIKDIGRENIYLGTDPDREGEAIAFHLCAALGLDFKQAKRVSFQEITEIAVTNALQNPRKIDLQLVSAQESRRAIDRLVGYQISPVLWKKLESGLSAGRVQSVALRLVVERERKINSFTERYSYQVYGFFKTAKGDIIKAKKKDSYPDDNNANNYLKSSINKRWKVEGIDATPIIKHPSPAYSTSSLQQDGVKKLKMNVKKVMDTAQKLFEAGHITYMRTDSLNISQTAIEDVKLKIINKYGEDYFQERHFKSKTGSQEAHEAIRPTNWDNATAGNTEEEKALYDLIYSRAMASQMSPAKYDQTTVTITSGNPDDSYFSVAKVLVSEGYLKAYQDQEEDKETDDNESVVIQPVALGELLVMVKLEACQVYIKPPKRFDQATLVAELEKKQIGRPSTYSNILNTIMVREYVKTDNVEGKKIKASTLILENGHIRVINSVQTLGSDKNKLIPTQKGERLTLFLEENFQNVIDYEFTANCEGFFDEIAEGKKRYIQVVPSFDQELSIWLSRVEVKYKDIQKEKGLGQFEGHPVQIGNGKYGSFIKHGASFYNIDKKELDGITIEKAIEIIVNKKKNVPKLIGTYQGVDVFVGKGKYGVFIFYNNKYYNIDATDPSGISLEAAVSVIENGQKPANNLIAKVGEKYQVRTGKWGMYITDGKKNVKVPETTNEEEVKGWTVEKCKSLFKNPSGRKKAK